MLLLDANAGHLSIFVRHCVYSEMLGKKIYLINRNKLALTVNIRCLDWYFVESCNLLNSSKKVVGIGSGKVWV